MTDTGDGLPATMAYVSQFQTVADTSTIMARSPSPRRARTSSSRPRARSRVAWAVIALPPTGMRYADERRTLADFEASRDVIGRALAAGRSSAVHARVTTSSARVRGMQ